MTTLDTPNQAAAIVADPAPEPAPAANPLAGNPGMVGLPVAISGATGLVLVNAGWFPDGALAGTLSILFACTSIGMLIATIWSAALAQNPAASIYGAFFGFYASYTALVIGLQHNWFGETPDSGTAAITTWLVCFSVLFAVMTLTSLRLPFAFTFIIAAVELALLVLLLGTVLGSTGIIRAGAACVAIFLGTAIYLYVDAMSRETGGDGLPLGRPLKS
ncbi:GPR1/FUN34/YaaH family transporter [Pseudonocardia sp.]|uniref:GPR1/FUN34/YaaH family transporter n=1 Tax=Pseudonocardia sp. TaxID=60912 RepID=UPI003D1092B7